MQKIAAHQGADFLGLQVIGIVIAGGQYVGAQHDPALDFVAESAGARGPIHIGQIGRVRGAVAVANPIVAG